MKCQWFHKELFSPRKKLIARLNILKKEKLIKERMKYVEYFDNKISGLVDPKEVPLSIGRF